MVTASAWMTILKGISWTIIQLSFFMVTITRRKIDTTIKVCAWLYFGVNGVCSVFGIMNLCGVEYFMEFFREGRMSVHPFTLFRSTLLGALIVYIAYEASSRFTDDVAVVAICIIYFVEIMDEIKHLTENAIDKFLPRDRDLSKALLGSSRFHP